MADAPELTIRYSNVYTLHCPHCEAETVQVAGGSGIEDGDFPRACLQCIADGGTCCSLAPLSRYKEAG